MDIRQSFCELLLIIFLLCIDSGLSFLTDEDYFDEPSFNRCPWIRNKLKNGRVRYRYKGRVAKFLCDSGFELAGKRSSTCVRGQWSNPVPVCVARGCVRVPTISNGRITEMYRGALLVYDCNPGYILDGNPTIHCDGRRWNASPPSCAIATEKPETYCDFENPDLCGWSQDPNHDFDWQRNQFSTPSGHVGTGPAFDHTFGENKAGFYLYIEASSPRKLNDTARLFSPVYPSDLSGGCFIFWYHMYGATTGGLRVYLKPESHVFDELTPMWQKFGDLGNQWLKGHMIVPVLHENFQIVIEGVRGESYVGDSAIDDVRLTSNLCDSDDNSTDISETVDQDSCRGRCQESGSESSCGCNANCVDEPNFCCRDYYTICTIGNSTSVPNTDEPPPEDYTTTSLVTSQSIRYTTLEHSEEISTLSTEPQPEKTESTNTTLVISSSTLSSTPISLKSDTSTEKSGDHLIKDLTTKNQTTVLTVSVSSTNLKTEDSTVSTRVRDTTQRISSVTPVSTTTTSTILPTTMLKTTVTSTTPQTTQPTSTTQPTTIVKTQETTSTAQPSTLDIKSTAISTLPSTLETTLQTVRVPAFVNKSTTYNTSISSFSTESVTTSTSAATTSNTEQIISSTTTISSTRKTYNLRPRNRTVSAMAYTAPPTTIKSTLSTNAHLIESTSSSSPKSSSQYLTSWHRYAISISTTQQSTSSLLTSEPKSPLPLTTKINVASESTFDNTPSTTRIFKRLTKPTKSSLRKTSDFYESKSETTSSNSSMPVVVSIIVVILICLIAGTVYYFTKKRGKRQSKLSDDSEMRFLQENDYMDYSDASALDKILTK